MAAGAAALASYPQTRLNQVHQTWLAAPLGPVPLSSKTGTSADAPSKSL